MKIVMSWSGGKDSAIALHELLETGAHEVTALMTSVSEEYRRISHHGVREALLDEQANCIGLPLNKIYLPSGDGRGCTNDIYEVIMNKAMAAYRLKGIRGIAFGDLFLQDLREWREASLAKTGMRGIFPLWHRDTDKLAREVIHKLAREVIRLGYKAYLSCVDACLGPGYAGRAFDDRLLEQLPPGIDPCGENGEFHTFVYDGPIFRRPVNVGIGEIVVRDERHYADLLLAGCAR